MEGEISSTPAPNGVPSNKPLRRAMTDTERNAMRADFKAGKTITELMKKYDRHDSVVRSALGLYKPKPRPSPQARVKVAAKRQLTPAEQGRVLAMNRAGKSAQQIAKLMQLDYGTVNRVLENDDVKVPDPRKGKSTLPESRRKRILELAAQGLGPSKILTKLGGDFYAIKRTLDDAGVSYKKLGERSSLLSEAKQKKILKLHAQGKSIYTIHNTVKCSWDAAKRVIDMQQHKALVKQPVSTLSPYKMTTAVAPPVKTVERISRDALLFEVLAVRLGKKTKEQAFDAIEELVG